MQYIHLNIEGWGCGPWCYPMQRGHMIKKVSGNKRREPNFTQFVSLFTTEVVGVFDSFRNFPDDMINSAELSFFSIYGKLLHTSLLPYII